MIVLNDFPCVTHPVQIVWFLDDYRYECVTVDENSIVCVPDSVSRDSSNIKGTLVVNGLFTSAINEPFLERCRDPTNTYTLSAAVLHPTNVPAQASKSVVVVSDDKQISKRRFFENFFKRRETRFVAAAAATLTFAAAVFFTWPSITAVVVDKRKFSV
jgi:hypothetical protein